MSKDANKDIQDAYWLATHLKKLHNLEKENEKLKERNTPMKPTRPDCYALHCPICNNIVFDFKVERQDYCSNCGQAIDWSE